MNNVFCRGGTTGSDTATTNWDLAILQGTLKFLHPLVALLSDLGITCSSLVSHIRIVHVDNDRSRLLSGICLDQRYIDLFSDGHLVVNSLGDGDFVFTT